MKPKTIAAALVAGMMALGMGPAVAACTQTDFEGQSFSTCTVQQGDDLRLFLNDDSGAVYGSFARINGMLERTGQRLIFAMNAGMFHTDRRPVGLYVEDHAQTARLVTRAGPGNFGMLPNGVFCIQDDAFRIIESVGYSETRPDCRFATQSGPMLVIDGTLHPQFLPDSTSLNIRNGVGVSEDGQQAVFVISDSPVTFHRFARFFRDVLGVRQALYLDGSVSRLYAPDLGRSDWGLPMGPIVGLVGPAD